VTISVGVAQHKAGEPLANLMERADEALYASKRSGRNRVTNAERLAQAAA
jgi:diguanylate cyclase